jgi:hypothetical protein
MTTREISPDVNTPNPQGGFNSLFLRKLTNNIQSISPPWGFRGRKLILRIISN